LSYYRDEGDGQQFGIPEKEELLKKTVIVCTLGTSSYLVSFTYSHLEDGRQRSANWLIGNQQIDLMKSSLDFLWIFKEDK
jgi:hypothetical protein